MAIIAMRARMRAYSGETLTFLFLVLAHPLGQIPDHWAPHVSPRRGGHRPRMGSPAGKKVLSQQARNSLCLGCVRAPQSARKGLHRGRHWQRVAPAVVVAG